MVQPQPAIPSDLRLSASQQKLKANFEAYLDGFSPKVQDILEKFSSAIRFRRR